VFAVSTVENCKTPDACLGLCETRLFFGNVSYATRAQNGLPMNRKFVLLFATAALVFCGQPAQAQSTFHGSGLSNEAAQAGIEVRRLPSDFFGKTQSQPIEDPNLEPHRGNNLAVLLVFAFFLTIGGAIVCACVMTRRKSVYVRPPNMVNA